MRFRGGEFSTGTTGNFQPELTPVLKYPPQTRNPGRLRGDTPFKKNLINPEKKITGGGETPKFKREPI